jgi:hypothetical protein
VKNILDFVAPATWAKHSARKEATRFALTVKPGRTYYSVVNIRASYPGAPSQLLMEWRFTAPGRWIGQEARCGHTTAAGAWLGYGPLHETRPAGLLTYSEFSNLPDVFEAEKMIRRGNLTPAGV